ncbi:hypothetical protein PsorP6_017289 [Peronosclerospora sorghi]|uniref:Uncharacterized protein n=1 Tax=Peronosclerospora sorghi TaxID=230839 RepID=A0ACC0WM12_9STRA|nr:hypothetical protein PsorP6_017289 [Peronosclerospora sorghi]
MQPAASPNKKARKSRVVFDFTTEEMAKYFHMSQREAAQQLGVATVTIKRNCRRLGIVWPYRLMKSKKHAINWSAISREDAHRIRQERALEQAKAGRRPVDGVLLGLHQTVGPNDTKAPAITFDGNRGDTKLLCGLPLRHVEVLGHLFRGEVEDDAALASLFVGAGCGLHASLRRSQSG